MHKWHTQRTIINNCVHIKKTYFLYLERHKLLEPEVQLSFLKVLTAPLKQLEMWTRKASSSVRQRKWLLL